MKDMKNEGNLKEGKPLRGHKGSPR